MSNEDDKDSNASQPKRRRKAVPPKKGNGWLRFDKILNVIVVVMLLLWVAGKFIEPPVQDEVIVPKTLEEQASSLFGKEETGASSQSDIKDITNNADITSSDYNQVSKIETEIIKDRYGIISLTADMFDGAIAQTNEKPLILFVYASWCPYCKKQFPVIDDIARNQSDKYKVLAVSIDKKREDLAKYIAALHTPPAFDIYDAGENISKRALYSGLQKKSLQFTGAVPYTVIFWQGKKQAELSGFLNKEKFDEILGELDSFIKKNK